MPVVSGPQSLESITTGVNSTSIPDSNHKQEETADPRMQITSQAAFAEAERVWKLAESCFVWCDDCMSRESLCRALGLYEAALGYVLVGTSRRRPSTSPLGPDLSEAQLRSRALQLRYEVAIQLRAARDNTPSPTALFWTRRIAIAAACLAVLAIVSFSDRLGDSLAIGEVRGITWVSSSHSWSRPMNGTLRHSDAPFFFHTEVENSPWVELDLGRVVGVRRAVIRNRLDCCLARAVPLIIETSQDHVSWATVARQPLPFETWRVDFARKPVRWVRLRVLRRTALHLSDVTLRI